MVESREGTSDVRKQTTFPLDASGETASMKGYVVGYASRKTPGEENIVDVAFDHRLEKAFPWTSNHEAENECKLLEGLRVTIETAQGGKQTLEGFKVERRGLGELVIFCEGLFTRHTLKGTSSEI